MPTIAGTFVTSTGPVNGATVYAWLASRFTSVPAENAAAPSGSADAGPVTTGTSWGGDGQFQVSVQDIADYYIQIVDGSNTYWQLWRVGASTNATELQGTAVGTTAPTSGQVLEFDGTAWSPSSSIDATALQGVAVATTTPTSGYVLEYDGTAWGPAALPTQTLTSLSGTLSAVVDLSSTAATTVFTTASLAAGTWLVSVHATFYNDNTTLNEVEGQLVVGTATATFGGSTSGSSGLLDASSTAMNTGDIDFVCLVTVTAAGTLEFQARQLASSTTACTAVPTTPGFNYSNATGYAAVKIA